MRWPRAGGHRAVAGDPCHLLQVTGTPSAFSFAIMPWARGTGRPDQLALGEQRGLSGSKR
ncbi:hypothetical protein GCM10023238_38370 [Streptomyces heliomycini]